MQDGRLAFTPCYGRRKFAPVCERTAQGDFAPSVIERVNSCSKTGQDWRSISCAYRVEITPYIAFVLCLIRLQNVPST